MFSLFNPNNTNGFKTLDDFAREVLKASYPVYYTVTSRTGPLQTNNSNALNSNLNTSNKVYEPHYVVKYLEDKLVVEAELPGYEKEDFEISISPSIQDNKNSELSIHAESSINDKVCNLSLSLKVLYDCINLEALAANYSNGLLEVTVPFSPRNSHKIEVT